MVFLGSTFAGSLVSVSPAFCHILIQDATASISLNPLPGMDFCNAFTLKDVNLIFDALLRRLAGWKIHPTLHLLTFISETWRDSNQPVISWHNSTPEFIVKGAFLKIELRNCFKIQHELLPSPLRCHGRRLSGKTPYKAAVVAQVVEALAALLVVDSSQSSRFCASSTFFPNRNISVLLFGFNFCSGSNTLDLSARIRIKSK